jgi:hypothetical protein
MKLPDTKKILELYSNSIEKFVINFEDYLKTDNKISELKCHIGFRLAEISCIIADYTEDKKLLLRRLKRNKKQTITYCLELLSIRFDEEIRNLMRIISNKRHTWKIVQDKKLKYSWDFIESIFD